MRFLTVDYDVATCRRLLRSRGLPRHAIHYPPQRIRRRLARLRRLAASGGRRAR
ncbi:MAG: hypothetical protein ACR2MA_05685 [Egibacteraceae bacterium]